MAKTFMGKRNQKRWGGPDIRFRRTSTFGSCFLTRPKLTPTLLRILTIIVLVPVIARKFPNYNIFQRDLGSKSFKSEFYASSRKFKTRISTRKPASLVLLTISNQVHYTLMTLQSIEDLAHEFDVLVFDDASVDGSADVLARRGFAVHRSEIAVGLTSAWNFGYSYALKQRYKNIFFVNNDVLVPNGSLDLLERALVHYPLVVPLTTTAGAGHNPFQSLYEHYPDILPLPRHITESFMNYQKIQGELLKRMSLENNTISCQISRWRRSVRFNGFFFGVSLKLISPTAFGDFTLFDPSNTMVGQEDELMGRMEKCGLRPYVCTDVYVYHWKSATVSKSGYVMGSKIETRNNISIYHQRGRTRESLSALESERCKDPFARIASSSLTISVGIIISNRVRNPAAGDIISGKEIGNALKRKYGFNIVLIDQGPNMYDVFGIDIILVLVQNFDVRRCYNMKPNLVRSVWIRNWFTYYASASDLPHYDIVFSSSSMGARYIAAMSKSKSSCVLRCPRGFRTRLHSVGVSYPSVLPLASNTNVFDLSQGRQKGFDFVFTGSYWGHFRKVMNLSVDDLSHFKGAVFGSGWEQADLDEPMKALLRGPLPYKKLPELYASTKIVIDDANHVSGPWGALNSRVFDSLASGALVLSNNLIGSQELFHSILPVWNSPEELHSLLKFYLANDENRYMLSSHLQEMVLAHHTYRHRAERLVDVLRKRNLLTSALPASIHAYENEMFCMCVAFHGEEKDLFLLQSRMRVRFPQVRAYYILGLEGLLEDTTGFDIGHDVEIFRGFGPGRPAINTFYENAFQFVRLSTSCALFVALNASYEDDIFQNLGHVMRREDPGLYDWSGLKPMSKPSRILVEVNHFIVLLSRPTMGCLTSSGSHLFWRLFQ